MKKILVIDPQDWQKAGRAYGFDMEIVEVANDVFIGEGLSWVKLPDGEWVVVEDKWLNDYEEPTDSLPPVPSGCECGAKFTSFPQFHSYWCPEYKE